MQVVAYMPLEKPTFVRLDQTFWIIQTLNMVLVSALVMMVPLSLSVAWWYLEMTIFTPSPSTRKLIMFGSSLVQLSPKPPVQELHIPLMLEQKSV